ncbi:MAG: glycosyltransferase family 2 protein [Gemmatimonadota bacterium]
MIYFLVPVYDEEGTIGLVLYKLRQVMEKVRQEYLVIVLDDGSADSTAKVVEAYRPRVPVKILRHARNQGFGPSLDRLLREAVRLSRHPESDVAILVEADFSLSPDPVPEMIREIEAGADIVIGSRKRPERTVEAMPFARRFSDWVSSSVLRAVMPIPGVTDYTSSLRAYRVGTLKRAVTAHQEGLITSPGTSANVELLLRLARFHPAIAEVDVSPRCDIRARPSRHRVKSALKGELGLTGRVDRVTAPPR